MQRKISSKRKWGVGLTAALIIGTSITFFRAKDSESRLTASENGVFGGAVVIDKELLAAQLGPSVVSNQFPEMIDLSLDGGTRRAHIEYALDQESQEKMEKIIGQYKPDYAAFVAMDAKTGRVLSMVSYSAIHPEQENLALRATFPAASIFKVVTASAALDLDKATPATVVPFNGSNHTLYKKNVEDNRITRWTRRMTMREAFARSVNTFFGKMGLNIVGPQNLMQYAERYMFNQQIRADIPVETGYARFNPEDPWSVVSAASGFTRDNTMSPLQGALIAAAVANDGVMMEPYIVESVKDENGGDLYVAEPRPASIVVAPEAAEDLRELFHETVRSGTSRKSFRQISRRSAYDEVEFGGKTGSLTGLNPQGKCDWFVGYARYRGERIAVAALTVNEKKWRVKSSMLANLFFEKHLKAKMSEGAFVQHKHQ